MLFTKDQKMADIIHKNYLLLNILPRFEIYLGFGDKTIEKICQEKGINVDFFLEIVNSFTDKSYYSKNPLERFSLNTIVAYLRNTHSFYIDEKIPEIESFIQRLSDDCKSENKENLVLLHKFFSDYKSELNEHIKREEDKVLPYVLELEEAHSKNELSPELHRKIERYSIRDYAEEHDNVEEKLNDLKNIIIKYLPSAKNGYLCNKVVIELFRLERDLNDHSHIEDKVLVPKVEQIENYLLSLV